MCPSKASQDTKIQSKSAEVWHLVSPLTSFVCNGYFSCNKVITERHKCPRNFFQCLSISTSSQTFPSRVPRLISQIGNQQGGFVSWSQSTSYHLATYFHQKIPFFGAGPRGDPVSRPMRWSLWCWFLDFYVQRCSARLDPPHLRSQFQ